MNHSKLIAYCVDILEQYSVSFLSPEDHLNQYLDAANLNDVDGTFVSEVFAGILRYKNITSVITKAYYSAHGKSTALSNKTLLDVLSYLTLFRLDEIDMPHFRQFVRSQDFNLMYRFFKFFINETSLKTWMKDEWNKLYDVSFVDINLLSPIQRRLPELQEMIAELKEKVDAKTSPPKQPIESTKVKEFKLTKPRPRSVPLPNPIPKLKKHQPVPKAIYSKPQEFSNLQQQRVVNRRQAEGRLMESSKKQYNCANPEKSQKTVDRVRRIQMEEDSKLQFAKHRAKPVPKELINSDVPIKLNAATILREGILFKKREENIIKKLESLEAGAHDASKFTRWQEQMREKDMADELAAIERRRLEGKLSHEEAILSRQRLIQEKQRKVDEIKEENKELMTRYLDERLEEEQLMRSLVEVVMSGRENAKDAKKKLIAYKAKMVQEVNEESKELMRQALEEAEIEMKKKVELIHQIRAMEAAPINRNKLVDFTETAGYRFLNEMSIAELRERLALMRDEKAEEQESKRDEILACKQAKDRMLMNTLTVISKHRAEETRARTEQRLNSKARRKNTSQEVEKDEKLLALQEKLEQKKAERLEAQQKLQVKPSPNSLKKTKLLLSDKNKSEERRWSEIEKTKKRVANMKANGLLNNDSRVTKPDGSRLAVSIY